MVGTVVKQRKGVIWIRGDDGFTYYGTCRRHLKPGTEVGFHINQTDSEVADNVITFGINPEYSFRDNIISLLVGILIGAAICFFIAKPVHAATISDSDKALMIQIVHAEAGNQDLLGRRLVADVVLNRMEHEDFPNTVKEVIYQPGQFQPVANGSINLKPDELDALAVDLELKQRTNNSVLFFRRGRYSDYGEPHFKVGDHFFS